MSQATPCQRCPNCGFVHDVSVYVTGQKILCRCKLHFEVQRQDVRSSPTPTPLPATRSGVKKEIGDLPWVQSLVSPEQGGLASSPGKQSSAGDHEKDSSPNGKAEGEIPEETVSVLRTDNNLEGAATVVCKPIQLPGFEMLQLIGRGGMGEVWKARQRSLGRDVAIKFLSPELAKGSKEFVRRFEKEATALASLSHPNIVQIIDRGCSDDCQTWFFVMEFCKGRSLREWIMNRSLSLAKSLGIVAQVAYAVHYAHCRGVIHRDLKPENILVDDLLQVKVVDFGLAGFRKEDGLENLTGASTAMGTLHYMAPEQRRDAHAVDERADIFSLGVILYEALTGEVPVGRFKMPSERLGVDARLDKIISKALEADPDFRYSRAKDMAVEIVAVLSREKMNALRVNKAVPSETKKRRKFILF